MNDKSNEFYNLIVFCEGTMTGFIVDSDTLDKFEQSFNSDKTLFCFINKEDNSEVILRNNRLIGYKKSVLADEYRESIIKVNGNKNTAE